MCRAVLPDGIICETTNFDSADACTNCGAPRQANEGFPAHEDELASMLLSGAKNVAHLGREKAKQYGPVAAAAAQSARTRAGNFAMHSRIATQTGVHPASVVSIAVILLIVSIALPVALNWPLTLTFSERQDLRASSADHETQRQIEGSLREAHHNYSGVETVVEFVPKQVNDARRPQYILGSLLSGPILISGSSVVFKGTGQTDAGGLAKAAVNLDLSNGGIFWISAIVLILLLLIADLLIGDIYAMQKLLIALVLVWTGYCLLFGMFAQMFIKQLSVQLFPDVSMALTVGGLMTAPVKIAFIGLIYWMTSMILRSLHEERSAAAAEKRRLAIELD